MPVTAAVAGTVQDGAGDCAGSTMNQTAVAVESGADECNEQRESAPELQSYRKERSDGSRLCGLMRGEKLSIPRSFPARVAPVLSLCREQAPPRATTL